MKNSITAFTIFLYLPVNIDFDDRFSVFRSKSFYHRLKMTYYNGKYKYHFQNSSSPPLITFKVFLLIPNSSSLLKDCFPPIPPLLRVVWVGC